MSDRQVRIAHLAVARDSGRLVAIGLGSCVAIALYDAQRRIAGLAHALLPDPSVAHDRANPARFASEAVPALIDKMRALGAHWPLIAKLAGGASLFQGKLQPGGGQMGQRNVQAAREALARVGLRPVAEDVGGTTGRSVAFDVATGLMTVRGLRGGVRVL